MKKIIVLFIAALILSGCLSDKALNRIERYIDEYKLDLDMGQFRSPVSTPKPTYGPQPTAEPTEPYIETTPGPQPTAEPTEAQ